MTGTESPAVPLFRPPRGGATRARRPTPAHVADPQWTIVFPVTSMRGGYEHLVPEQAMIPGSAGRYAALCEHIVWATALACPAGPPCQRCAAIRGAGTKKPGVWARLAARFGRRSVRR